MKKRSILLAFVLILGLFSLTACKKSDAMEFKLDHESLNGVVNANGKEHRTVTIPEKNPIIISSASEVIKKLENKETFYVYFGSKLCPWCRSVIEKAMEVANNNGIDKIYYVDIWDDEGKEILRDKYTLDDNGNSVKVDDGTEEYFKLLEYLGELLPKYTYAANKNGGSQLNIDEARIYIPAFIYVVNGKPIRYITGISDLQTSSREELTEEMLKEEEELFDNFFLNVCDENC